MRILKQGVNPDDIVQQGTCYRCRTEVEFTRKEAKFHCDQRDGDSYSVPCPVCNSRIYSNVGNGWSGR